VNWVGYAALSALFAGLTAVLAKVGVSKVPSNVATLVRTVVVVAFATAVVVASGQLHHLRSISARDWLALVLSGVATGCSWIFYFAALKHGPISGVAPIDKLSFVIAMTLGFLLFKETVRPLTLLGAALIVAGVLLTLSPVQQELEQLR
jgi:transporter family protein